MALGAPRVNPVPDGGWSGTLKPRPAVDPRVRCGSCGAANAANAPACGQCGAPSMPAARPRPLGPAPTVRMQEGTAPVRPRDVAFLLAYVLVSSYLGLTGRFLFVASPLEALRFMGDIWSASVVADFVFVAGTVAAGVSAYRLTRRGSVLGGLVLALAATWITYALSWALVLAAEEAAARSQVEESLPLLGIFAFVGAFGVVGLLFGTVAPVVLGARDRATALARRPVPAPL